MSTLMLRGGTVWTSESEFVGDIFIEDGTIKAVGASLEMPADREIDLSGKIVMPGGVDVHTHLESPTGETITADDFYTGTVAAACGGTTTIVDFASQAKGQKLEQTLESHHAKAGGKAVIDYGFHLAVTDLYDDVIQDLRAVVDSGVTSFKIFMGYPGVLMLDDGEIYRILQAGGRYGAKVCIHAENGPVVDRMAADLMKDGKTGPLSHALSRPPSTEVEAVTRGIALSRMAEAPVYFVHMSTAGAVEAIAEARDQGLPVAGETCSHYLTLDESWYRKPDFEGGKAVLTPPLRGEVDRSALWRGLNSGSLSVVSSDHCPFCFDQKKIGIDDFRRIPNGGPGIEHRISLMYAQGVRTGQLTPQKFVDLVSTTPAKSFGMFPRKGTISPGADADLVVIDPDGETTISAKSHHMSVDYSLWEGWKLPGSIERVFSRGSEIVTGSDFVGDAGRGNFIARATE